MSITSKKDTQDTENTPIVNNLDRIFFLDVMSVENFINFSGRASVILDPLYFGGGNSFHESMFYGTPAVSKPTEYLKSKVIEGAYKQMGIKDAPIVNSSEEYIDKAIEIANLPPNKLLEMKIRYREAANKNLFENKKYINELEEFLTSLF